MNAVGDVADRDRVGAAVGPEVAPHRAADLAVTAAHPVRRARRADRERRHPEGLPCVLGAAAPESQQLVAAEAELRPVRRQMRVDELDAEDVVAGGDRGVRREDAPAPHALARRRQRRSLADLLAQQLEREEGRVALVHVVDRRVDAERAQRAHPADPERQLLHHAGVLIPAVEMAGDPAVALLVVVAIGVEEVERDAADTDAPDAQLHRATVDREGDRERHAVAADHALDRQGRDVEVDVALRLPRRTIHLLEEVALPVEQADADERQPEVGRRLQVIGREDAEAAGVDRQRLVNRELGREVRDRPLRADPRLERLGPRRRLPHRALEAVQEIAGAEAIERIGVELGQARRRDVLEEAARIVAARVPARRRDVPEELRAVDLPAPPVVAGERAKLAKERRNDGGVRATGLEHGPDASLKRREHVRNAQSARRRFDLNRAARTRERVGPVRDGRTTASRRSRG